MKSYIYLITNLINNKTYIGKSNGNNKYYYTGGLIIKKAINKYGKENFKKEIIIEGNFNEEQLNSLEKYYIKLLSPKESILSYNLTDGGEGISGFNHNIKTKEIISKFSKISSNRESHINMISKLKYWKNKKRSQKVIDKIIETNSKKIIQYDLNGQFIKIWNSGTEASRFYNLKNPIPILSSANPNNRKKSSCGFMWRFYEDGYKLKIEEYKDNRKT